MVKRPKSEVSKSEGGESVSIVDKIMIAYMCPKLMTHCEFHIPDEEDSQPAYPLNTTAKYQPDFTQVAVTYPTGHPLAGQTVTDISGSYKQLTIIGGDEVTQCLYLEAKNGAGDFCPYRATHPQGSSDFPMPCGSNVVQASGLYSAPELVFLDAGAGVYDSTLVSGSSAANSTAPLGLGAGYNSLTYKAFHGTLLAVGKSKKYGGRTYMLNSGATQATIGAACTPISANDAFVSLAFSANVLSSCVIVQAGTGGAFIGDTFHFALYGYNEGAEYPICNINFRLTGNVAANGFLCALPSALRDEVRLQGSVSITQALNNVDTVRNVSWGVVSCGGQLTSQMMNGINSPFVIGQYSQTRLISCATDADNWTSEFSIGARAGSVQFPVGQYYGNFGLDQGNSYNGVANQPDEDTDVLKFGNSRYLCPAGSGRFTWRENVSTVSTLYSPSTGVFTGTLVMVSYDLEGRNQYIQVFVSPGVGGTQAAQMLEIEHTVMAEALTSSITLQTHQATTSIDVWTEAAHRLARCKHSARKPDPAYYFSTENYKELSRARFGVQQMI